MATRNQVLSLFGASPEQILEQRRREQASEVLKQRDPFARAGGAIGMGLARLFGGEPAEVTRQRELYSQLEGVNFENPEQMRAAAASLSSQFPDRALQLLSMAEQSEARQQQIATSQAQATKAGFTTAPRFVGYTDTYGKDAMGQTVVMGKKPLYENTPLPLADYDKYINKEGAYADWYPKKGEASGPATQSNALPEGSVTFGTGIGTPVALLPNGKYATLTDEGNIGAILDEQGLKALGGLVDPKRAGETPEGEGILDTISSVVKGRNVGQTPDTPTVPKTTSDAEKERQARIAAKRGDIIPDWLQGRRYDQE